MNSIPVQKKEKLGLCSIVCVHITTKNYLYDFNPYNLFLFRVTVDRWHSFNRKSYQQPMRQQGTQINGFSSGQMLHLRKRALLR